MLQLKMWDNENKKIVSDIIDPTPGLFVDGKLNLENQFEYKSNDIDKILNLSRDLQDRLNRKNKNTKINRTNSK